jgi:hypothetical protein
VQTKIGTSISTALLERGQAAADRDPSIVLQLLADGKERRGPAGPR